MVRMRTCMFACCFRQKIDNIQCLKPSKLASYSTEGNSARQELSWSELSSGTPPSQLPPTSPPAPEAMEVLWMFLPTFDSYMTETQDITSLK